MSEELKMEEDLYDPSEINSFDVNNVIVIMTKKRKLGAEQLGLPLPKHNCCNRGFTSELDSPSDRIPEIEGFCAVLVEGGIHGEERDKESGLESVNGSNSFSGDANSISSVSDGVKTDVQYWKAFSVDHTSTPVTRGGDYHKNSMYSLDSRATKSRTDKDKSSFMDADDNSPRHDVECLASLKYDQLFEYENNLDYNFSEYADDSIAECTNKEFQELLFHQGKNQNKFVLSSGRWDVNQETRSTTEKLTIDKEFEQYFSMLML